MELSKLTLFAMISLFLTEGAWAKFSYRPGLDINTSYSGVKLRYRYCTRSDSEHCSYTHASDMGISDSGLSLYLQKPFKSKFAAHIFHYDWGFIFPLRILSFTNDTQKNADKMISYGPDGEVIEFDPERIELRQYILHPLVYVQGGITIPYLPYILLSLGTGPEFTYGRLLFETKRFDVTAYRLASFLELELNVLRSKWLGISLYGRVFPFIGETELHHKQDEWVFSVQQGQTGLGIRLHTQW